MDEPLLPENGNAVIKRSDIMIGTDKYQIFNGGLSDEESVIGVAMGLVECQLQGSDLC